MVPINMRTEKPEEPYIGWYGTDEPKYSPYKMLSSTVDNTVAVSSEMGMVAMMPGACKC